jgi:acetate---CoA ligase (ADP-forming)
MTPAAVPGFDLRALFAPRSIAVVGASPRNDLARTVRDNIAVVGGAASCWFVNPRYDDVDGSPCFPDLASLPEVPDTVVLAVNPLRAAAFTRKAAAAGVRAVVIPGGGVVEGGEPAARMQAEVAEIARATGTAILGPNCMGLVDLTTHTATYIDELPPSLRRGGVAGIAQSGSVCDAFLQSGPRIGWSRVVSCGSEVALDLCDHLALCLDDPETQAIVAFVEGFKRPERFLALADQALALGKPLAVVKVGRSPQAQAAAVLHTGSLAGEARVTDAALRAVGAIRCDDLDELLEVAALLSGSQRRGRSVGRGRTGVVTVSTGEGSLVADLAPGLGLDLPPVPASAEARIREALPTLAYVANPVDPWGANEASVAYGACLRAFVDSGGYDVIALVHDFPFRSQAGETALAVQLAGELVKAAEGSEVLPVFVSLTSGDVTPEVEAVLDATGGAPVLRGAAPAFGAIARLARWEAHHRHRQDVGPARADWPALAGDRTAAAYASARAADPPTGERSRRVLSERESLERLGAAGVPVIAARAARDADAAVVAAESLGFPVAMKLEAPGVVHKSDVGGVALDLADAAAVRSAADRMLKTARAAGLEAALVVEPMAASGVELLVGARRDAQFGLIVLTGLGGLLAEVVDDVAIRLAPLTAAAAREMLDELRGSAVLIGLRGRPVPDVEAIVELIVAAARAIEANPDWLALDLNPIIVSATGAIAVDASLIIDEVAKPTRPRGLSPAYQEVLTS